MITGLLDRIKQHSSGYLPEAGKKPGEEASSHVNKKGKVTKKAPERNDKAASAARPETAESP